MHRIDDSEKEGRKSALGVLAKLMAERTGKKLAGLKKKPAVSVTEVAATPADPHMEPDGDEDDGVCPHCGGALEGP